MTAPLCHTVPITGPLDLPATVGPGQRGRHDPCFWLSGTEAWRATRTPDGPATVHLVHRGQRVEAEAWGAGAETALAGVAALIGADDDDRMFPTPDAVVGRLQRVHPGMRVGRTGAVAEALVPSVLEQKVTSIEARRSYRAVVADLGEPAPGPAGAAGLRVPPAPADLSTTPLWTFHRWGVERRRADTLRRACSRASRLEEAAGMPLADAYRRLEAFPGVGAWTSAEVALVALGDADAVPVGDYHLPHVVSWALTGERRGSDERMLELLEPYRGHRARVLRLLVRGGSRPPARGPRHRLRSIAAI